jgi:hypothetical protein
MQREDEEEATFILDATGDQSLTQDYIAFPQVDSDSNSDSNSDNSSLESGESELYDLDKDYSWFGRYNGVLMLSYIFLCILYNKASSRCFGCRIQGGLSLFYAVTTHAKSQLDHVYQRSLLTPLMQPSLKWRFVVPASRFVLSVIQGS